MPLPDFALAAAPFLLPCDRDTKGNGLHGEDTGLSSCTSSWVHYDRAPCGNIATGQWGAPLMSTYLPEILTYLAFGILMAACLWYVDGSLKDDAD